MRQVSGPGPCPGLAKVFPSCLGRLVLIECPCLIPCPASPAAGKLIIEIWSPYILTSLFWCSICKIWRVSKVTAISIKLMIILSTISASLARINCNLFEFVWTWGWRSGIKRNRQSHQQGLRAHFLPQISSGLPRCPGQPAHHQKKWYLICYFAVSRKSLHL